ncbi:hypothetical protein COV58_01800 [Candidatus Roizmanbacteria bacterium CG11_big_fil_rev_8_21_14_0_20_36_8]|uniref:Uncharacterized protein n=2 Tax=Candidatus Roizmaniibacteriota TaxID=1752723 RepID=A0A2M6IUJ4_9BACT|nr:MAG: hypothetical protein COV58_01800 [Candidatus Roizmanbacteria bacterium CG11_big_fil_rev_8_21_14_0_20_36_8]PIZ64822.1 MAG: hypothetical protein COY14_03720 [Candidatus Roizmanbacteria bacterium CG_4_10_14_0_2_um_filter_36_9]
MQFYRGKDGIRQMLWNELSAKTDSCVFVYKEFNIAVGQNFFQTWVEQMNERELTARELRTDLFDKDFIETDSVSVPYEGMNVRYLKYDDFPLTHGMTIYDNVVSIYNWWNDEIFGVEIYNQQVADMQRLFFETFWNMAKPVSKEKLVAHTRRSHLPTKEPKIY